jgi:predicted transcriptional regulator
MANIPPLTPDWGSLLLEMVDSGMTQREVAAAVGLSSPSVSNVISGKVKTTEYTRGLRILDAHKTAIRRAKRKSPKVPA